MSDVRKENHVMVIVSRSVRYRFFFFQAEDGIRDLTVTGVQTCALPISKATAVVMPSLTIPMGGARVRFPAIADGTVLNGVRYFFVEDPAYFDRDGLRSEERRVGKECRSRWSPYH